MDLSIVILNYKSKGLTHQCLKTIKECAPARDFEMIVVDNDSGDGVGAMLAERHPDVVFIAAPRNLGYAAGNNLGIRASRGRYVCVVNPDITVRPGSIDAMARYMDADPGVGVLGPKLVRPDGSIDESCFRFPAPLTPLYRRTPFGQTAAGRADLFRYVMADFGRDATRDVDWLLGAVLLVRREALEQVGLLDERFFLYFEDADWCRRFRAAGWRVVYFADASMVHFHERASARVSWPLFALSRASRMHVASWYKYFRKWGREEAVKR